jgi:glycosyltransferase involved in cell wall biosynthesis
MRPLLGYAQNAARPIGQLMCPGTACYWVAAQGHVGLAGVPFWRTREMVAPPLSVVMPVKNALPYLDAAIESILGQSFGDFEFIIRDDGSDDGTTARLRYWAARDRRIRLFESRSSLGPAGSSNWVVFQASAPIVARMDADDISHPDRLREQFDIMLRSTEAVLVGTLWQGIDRQGNIVRDADYSTLGKSSITPPFAHGSIMFRTSAFQSVGGYRSECDYWEDLDLYLRLSRVGKLLTIPRVLFLHRFSDTSTRLTSVPSKVENSVDLMFRCRRAHRRGGGYDDLLREAKVAPREKLHADTFLSLAFIDLWAGHRPRALGRLLRRGRLRPNAATVRALIWAVWAELSPRTLRLVMQSRVRWRNLGKRRLWGPGEAVEWR